MINFESIDGSFGELKSQWDKARPFRMIVIDDFADKESLNQLLNELPDPAQQTLSKSRDYIFAKNKFEKSAFRELGVESATLYSDLVSERFADFLYRLCGHRLWVDADFHGGGMHQGGTGSFLDMHVDFNTHPLHENWFRDLNILLYLNKDWRPEYGGQLKLRHKHTGESTLIDPIFNRCVIMETREYTLHGYDPIHFPPNQYRRSIACYAYSESDQPIAARSTVWYPERGGMMKRAIGIVWPTLVRWKGRFLGSATSKNR